MNNIKVTNIEIENNPSTFFSPFRITITFECFKPIFEDIQWKLVYIGSPKD